MQGGAKVDLQLRICETELILIFLLIIVLFFHTNNNKPTFVPSCISDYPWTINWIIQ